MAWFIRDKPTRHRARLGRPQRALTAAAQQPTARPGLRRLNQNWQVQALGFYDTCEVCWYPAQSYAKVFQRIRFFPAVLNERGEVEEVEDGPLVELWERVQDPGGGRTRLYNSYGRLQFVIADGYLTVSEDENGDEGWEYLSPLELRFDETVDEGKYRRIRAPGLETEELVEAPDSSFGEISGKDVRVWRLWRPHPTYSQWADASIRPVLPLFALLERLTLAANADSLSRAASRGGLFVPDELKFGVPPDADALDEDPMEDSFTQELIEALVANIADPNSAAAMAPIVLRGPAVLNTQNGAVPMADCIKWFQLGPEERYKEAEMWEKTIRRISLGVDLPPDYLTGSGDLNHWGGWLVDEQAFRLHFAQGAQNFCDDLASAYLRPAARDAGLPDADRVTLGFDPAEAINHPNEIETAQEAYDRYVVSSTYYREKIGATEDDAPDDAEIERRLEIERGGQPAAEPEQDGETNPADGGAGGDTDEDAPDDPDAGDEEEDDDTPSAVASANRILGAAEFAVERARELAGSRLRSKATGRPDACPECVDQIDGVPAARVAATLGADAVRSLITGSDSALVAGAGLAFAATLERWGVNGGWPDELGRMVEQHALRTLYEREPPPLPPGFTASVARAVR